MQNLGKSHKFFWSKFGVPETLAPQGHTHISTSRSRRDEGGTTILADPDKNGDYMHLLSLLTNSAPVYTRRTSVSQSYISEMFRQAAGGRPWIVSVSPQLRLLHLQRSNSCAGSTCTTWAPSVYEYSATLSDHLLNS